MKKLTATTILSATALTLSVLADVPLATSSPATFCLNTVDSPPFAVTSAAEAAEFADYPLTWHDGETLTVEAPDGTVTAFATDAASAGSRALALASGGVWRIVSSEEGTAYVCVPWSVFGDGGLVCSSSAAGHFAVDLLESGPHRKMSDRVSPPIAYSGDDWCNESTMSTLTVTPPEGGGAATVYDALMGTGVQPFLFNKTGRWTVVLAMEDGTTRTAVVSVNGGLLISLH